EIPRPHFQVSHLLLAFLDGGLRLAHRFLLDAQVIAEIRKSRGEELLLRQIESTPALPELLVPELPLVLLHPNPGAANLVADLIQAAMRLVQKHNQAGAKALQRFDR